MISSSLARNRVGRPQAWVEVTDGTARRRDATFHGAIGRDLVIDPKVLSRYLLSELPPLVDDLVVVAGAVALADRIVPRRPSYGRGRDLEVAVPVHDPDFWRQARVKGSLIDALYFLSNDCWEFHFRKRTASTGAGPQGSFPFGYDRSTVVMPYSDGLDSLAVARIEQSKPTGAALILVTTGRKKDADREWRPQQRNGRHHRVAIPFRLSDRHTRHRFREPSYRTRGFIYGVMAGIAAHLSGARKIIVPESGQGTLGPWMMPVGDEASDVRTHPLFTRRLEALIEVVLGSFLHFDHSRLWFTKGQTLRELRVLGGVPSWAGTRSCGRDARHIHLNGKRVQCGVCGACLLRRQSLLAAGFDEGEDHYLWRGLGAPTLDEAAPQGGRQASLNDKRQAVCGALSMARFANLAAGGADADRYIARATDALAVVLDEKPHEIEMKLRRLLANHRDEWQAFIAKAGPGSFIAEWTEGLQC